MKRMKQTLRIMITTGICIVALLVFVLWIMYETFQTCIAGTEFNMWSIYGLLITIAVIIVGGIASVFIMAWKHSRDYETRLKRLESSKNGGG